MYAINFILKKINHPILIFIFADKGEMNELRKKPCREFFDCRLCNPTRASRFIIKGELELHAKLTYHSSLEIPHNDMSNNSCDVLDNYFLE